MSLVLGFIFSAITAIDVNWGYFAWASFWGLVSIYWFVLAALEHLLDKIISKMVVQAFPMPMDPPKNYFDTTDEDN